MAYRGLPDRAPILRDYKKGRPIQWGSFTSVAVGEEGLNTAMSCLDDPGEGRILEIGVIQAKLMGAISFFPMEGEAVLSPMTKFLVTSEPYEVDGFLFLDLIQQDGECFYY